MPRADRHKMQLQVEYVDISTIKPYKGNAKTHPKEQIEQIKKSMQEFGVKDPIGIWHNEIVEGHGRYLALKELGEKTIPIIRLDDLTDEQRRAYTLVHNQLTMNSGFDLDTLKVELDNIGEIDMSEFGFSLDGIGEEPQEVQEDDFDVEPPAQPQSKLGDIYQLGEHKLMCGDSTNAEHVAKLMDGEKADLLVTDPPYNVDYVSKNKKAMKIQNDSMEDEAFVSFLTDAFLLADKNMKLGSSFYIWHADLQGYNFRKALKQVGWQLRETLIWNKSSLVLGRSDYHWKHEPCLYGWTNGTHRWFSDRKQATVIDFEKPQRSDEHPTMKPVGLFAYQINNSSKAGEIVLDIFGGSGTSIIACEQLNRKCYMMELDPKYVDVIIKRWEEYTGKKAVKIA